MRRSRADDGIVVAFMEAVFPDAPQLAMASFDEAHVLATATELIQRLRGDLRKATVKADGYREGCVAADAGLTRAREQFREFATWVTMQVAAHNEALAESISAEACRLYNQRAGTDAARAQPDLLREVVAAAKEWTVLYNGRGPIEEVRHAAQRLAMLVTDLAEVDDEIAFVSRSGPRNE